MNEELRDDFAISKLNEATLAESMKEAILVCDDNMCQFDTNYGLRMRLVRTILRDALSITGVGRRI